nr:hypothetical protein [Tanacetum cinerariifolium]
YKNTPSWDRPTIYYDDDDEDYTIAITPVLATEKPDNSLSMEDEHLETISATESDKVIKSSVENLVPIPIAPQYLLSFGNEDTIFDPGISICHSFMPYVSRWSGTFIKWNVYPKHLNGSPMEILFSTGSPWTNEFRVESGSRLG